ncbi:hypothetical protein PTKIN_Ptkin02bG0228800 [Pterospermum kingtungense]
MGILSDVNVLVKGSRHIFPLSNPNFSPKQRLVLPEPVSKFGAIVSSSCNGLLFLDDLEGNCLLWNPSTGEHKLLPSSSLEAKRHPDVPLHLFFCSGFGFDSRSQDYKVVRFLQNFLNVVDGEDRLQVELYSLNSDSWKRISCPPHYPHPYNNSAACIAGVYYWMADDIFRPAFILSFDFADEQFSSYSLPDYFVWTEHSVHLTEFDGSLAAVIYPYMKCGPFDIWVWTSGLWTNIFTIEPLPGVKPLPGVELLLGVFKNGEQIFIQGSNHQLFLYDGVTRELKDVSIPGFNPGRLMHYVETSVQLSSKSSGKIKLHDLPDKNKEV